MKICVLAWGSLQWDPRTLRIASDFKPAGLKLPIEFSRISGRDGPSPRLTLVVDEANGSHCETSIAQSSYGDLGQAKENLREREGMLHVNGVGFVDRQTGEVSFRAEERHPNAVDNIREWLEGSAFDAVVWTALASNFAETRGEPFSIDASLSFLNELSPEKLTTALEYINRAPEQTQTALREAIAMRWPNVDEKT